MEKLQASVDVLNNTYIAGWAMDTSKPDVALELHVYAQGRLLGKVTASQFRKDLKQINFGTGFYGFRYNFDPVLTGDTLYKIEIWLSNGDELKNCRCYLLTLDGSQQDNKELAVASEYECQGSIDILTRTRFKGWAHDSENPDTSVPLTIYDNGRLTTKIIANQYRYDLEVARLGDGCRGFNLFIPGGLTPADAHSLDITRERDGAHISGSPRRIASLDKEFDIALSNLVETAISSRREIKLLNILMAKADELTLRSDHFDTVIKRSIASHGEGTPADHPVTCSIEKKNGTILFLTSKPLYSHRVAFSYAVALKRLGHGVIALAVDEIGLMDCTPNSVAAADIVLYGAPLVNSVEDLCRSIGDYISVVYLDGSDICIRYINIIRAIAPHLKIIFNATELSYVTLSQKSRIYPETVQPGASHRTYLREMMGAWEADFVLIQNKNYLQAFPTEIQRSKVKCIPAFTETLKKIPNFEKRVGVCLILDVDYPPIQDGILWFVEHIIPKIRVINHDIQFTIIGLNIPRSMMRLLQKNLVKVDVVETSVIPKLCEFRVAVIPLQYGDVIKTSALDCLALGIPCVMTPIAFEGLGLSEDLLELIAVDEDTVADLVIKLHEDMVRNSRVSRMETDFVAQNLSLVNVARALQTVLEEITL